MAREFGDGHRIPRDHDKRGARLEQFDGDRQLGRQAIVYLYGDHGCSGLEQPEGEGAEPRADLHHALAGDDSRCLDDAAHRVGVDHEVLAELLGWLNAEKIGEAPDLRRPEQAHASSDESMAWSYGEPRSWVTGSASQLP